MEPAANLPPADSTANDTDAVGRGEASIKERDLHNRKAADTRADVSGGYISTWRQSAFPEAAEPPLSCEAMKDEVRAPSRTVPRWGTALQEQAADVAPETARLGPYDAVADGYRTLIEFLSDGILSVTRRDSSSR